MIIIIFITVIIIEQVAAINFVIWLVSFLICSPILVFQVSAFVFVSVYLYFVFVLFVFVFAGPAVEPLSQLHGVLASPPDEERLHHLGIFNIIIIAVIIIIIISS